MIDSKKEIKRRRGKHLFPFFFRVHAYLAGDFNFAFRGAFDGELLNLALYLISHLVFYESALKEFSIY